MIESIEFSNFKALRNTTLPLAPFTLLLGPNGSGKSTVLQAIQGIADILCKRGRLDWASIVSVTSEEQAPTVEVKLRLALKGEAVATSCQWSKKEQQPNLHFKYQTGARLLGELEANARAWLSRMQTYALDYDAIAAEVAIEPGATLQHNGAGLAAVLDYLQGNHPESWRALISELCQWLPEYDYILFDQPQKGHKAVALRTKKGHHRIPAKALSQGTLIALALLTIAYLPTPPSVVGLEEIDRGLHPRLLRHLQDALYRLSYPESSGEKRQPVQVIATTHSPYLLDLYRDHPEEVVLAQKEGLEVQMKRLSDIEYYQEILGDSPLSEVWYSGVLGGVSVKP